MSDNLSLKAFVVLMKASKSLQEQVKKDISNHGMKTSDFAVLEALYHKGKQTVREISEAVLINTGSITYVIDKLENKNYVERRHCSEDRRVVYIHITEEGKQIMDEIFPKHQKVIEQMFNGVNSEELQTTINVLKRVGQKPSNQ
ncbi:MarR family winged helix-turn-helix transcriptional regulator [Ornithinibacillus halophilus]|uniref:MarR family transcriptional regulator, 2-MHQ and catechol-resistance regulon repressor n=1 Tax=Ornithinibacillus halophilus TaxID=930117 RepID=A0A1M5DWP5_9BACI|nr:MarR family transcriptional regulator [Ornithinibacillus halophilus]SHF71448.1 MarR family transcriptional regulator, 2-MHQ and catechol-resistance regulon repressor [Ornithinibacillus halophilus]